MRSRSPARPTRPLRQLLICVALAIAAGCAPVRPSRDYTWIPSPNFDQRRPNFIVLHHTQNDTLSQALSTLTNPARAVSSHYLIGRDGRVLQLVDDLDRAWHAGRSWWGGHTDLNSISIGIELDNNGFEPFAEAQIVALETLLPKLVERFRIPPANVIGHGDIAPGRKVDPSRYFPWERLARSGYGLWCREPSPSFNAGFDPGLALMAIGYDVSRPDVARQAFRRHFIGIDSDLDWNDAELRVLACVARAQSERSAVQKAEH